jgi:hypothetical protein
MGNLKAVLNLDGLDGNQQRRLREEVKKHLPYVEVDVPPTDTFPFYDSTVDDQRVRRVMEAALEGAGLGPERLIETRSLRKDK